MLGTEVLQQEGLGGAVLLLALSAAGVDGHQARAGGSVEGHSWASNAETRTVAGAGTLTAIGGGLFGRTCDGWCGHR